MREYTNLRQSLAKTQKRKKISAVTNFIWSVIMGVILIILLGVAITGCWFWLGKMGTAV